MVDNTALTDYEFDILRSLIGEEVEGLQWGAAMSAAIEHLYEEGFATTEWTRNGIEYKITDKGREAVLSKRAHIAVNFGHSTTKTK